MGRREPRRPPSALDRGRLFLIDATSRLTMLEAGALDPVGAGHSRGLPAARPRIVGDLVLVELKTGTLVAYDIPGKLAKKWETALEGATLTGDPLPIEGRLLVALSDGRILWLDEATGQLVRTLDLGQQLGFGPRRWGETIVVGTRDGTLVAIGGADQREGIEK